MTRLPRILRRTTLARSRCFEIEELELEFANGERRTYERLPPVGTEAVMVVALTEADEVVLIREYAAGFHDRGLTLPKGSAEGAESLAQAAQRELMEETGFGASRIDFVKRLHTSPGHMGFTINVMFARDLYGRSLPCGEPERPEVVLWPAGRLAELIGRTDFNEARAIAALALVVGVPARPGSTSPARPEHRGGATHDAR